MRSLSLQRNVSKFLNRIKLFRKINIAIKLYVGAGEVAQQVIVLATKPDELPEFNSKNSYGRRTKSCMLPFDLHMCSVYTCAHTHKHTLIKRFKDTIASHKCHVNRLLRSNVYLIS